MQISPKPKTFSTFFIASKYSEFNVDFIEAIKIQKKFLVLAISVFEIDAVNSPDPNENTCNGQ